MVGTVKDVEAESEAGSGGDRTVQSAGTQWSASPSRRVAVSVGDASPGCSTKDSRSICEKDLNR